MANDTIRSNGTGQRWRIAAWGGAAGLLLLPLIAMRFTAEVAWDRFDFVFMAVMIGAVGLGLELAVRRRDRAYTAAVAIALLLCFLLIVVNGAVGVIGSERDDANLLFLGVVAVALFGTLAVRARPGSMARVMTATAVAQIAVPLVAAITGLAPAALLLAPEVPVLTIVFTALWLLSAWLFRTVAR